ncbi:hypothetical protein F4803DRAFT_507745 [Xylaria telfairii]|nr:hypothetical protein F4803DRAFT_507745 [Xylaria telfairii]
MLCIQPKMKSYTAADAKKKMYGRITIFATCVCATEILAILTIHASAATPTGTGRATSTMLALADTVGVALVDPAIPVAFRKVVGSTNAMVGKQSFPEHGLTTRIQV